MGVLMAYTIRLEVPSRAGTEVVSAALRARVLADGRFTCGLEDGPGLGDVVVRRVRMTTSRLGCGQHAGPCDLPRPDEDRPKRQSKALEWFDWIAFNDLVNDVLDELHTSADVWSVPVDTAIDYGRKLWVRRGTRRRLRWEVEERVVRGGPWTEYVADHGSEGQFVEAE